MQGVCTHIIYMSWPRLQPEWNVNLPLVTLTQPKTLGLHTRGPVWHVPTNSHMPHICMLAHVCTFLCITPTYPAAFVHVHMCLHTASSEVPSK